MICTVGGRAVWTAVHGQHSRHFTTVPGASSRAHPGQESEQDLLFNAQAGRARSLNSTSAGSRAAGGRHGAAPAPSHLASILFPSSPVRHQLDGREPCSKEQSL